MKEKPQQKKQKNHPYFDIRVIFLKLFSHAAKKSNTFIEQLLNLDKFFERLKAEYEVLVEKCKELQKSETQDKEAFLDMYYKVAEIGNFIAGLNDDMRYIEKSYYPEMKVTAYNLCDGKTSKELDDLNENISKYLKEFKGMQDAFDYICYNSGPLITDTVRTFVESLQNNGRKVSMQYFLDSEVVIAFNYIEWINLMKRLQFIKSKFKNDDYSITFLENYKNLEVCYAIILIFNAAVENN